jgi:[protein-PII] uridylyltransferase
MTPSEDTRTTEVVVCAPDHPGLFEEISGCFAAEFVDVQEANLFTLGSGIAVDCFRTARAGRGEALTGREMEALAAVLTSVVSGAQRVDALLRTSRRRVFSMLHPALPVRTEIRFDNRASRGFTVVDVLTGDRTGVLYDMAKAFRERGIDVSTARIVTDARRVRDSFYISRHGEKLEDSSELAELEDVLRSRILGRLAAPIEGGVG